MNLKKRFIKVFSFILVGSLLSCSSKKKTEPIDPVTGSVRSREAAMAEKFEAAGKLLDAGQNEKAAAAFDTLMIERPVSTLDGMILYNSGIAHYNMKDCEAAVIRFRKAQRFAASKIPQLELRAKLRLTEAYSCLGQHKNALLLLLEVYKDRSKLPLEMGEAEVPARIAAAYAQNGNRKQADQFFKKAERGLKLVELKNENLKENKEILAKTLFMMGNLSVVKPESLDGSGYFNAVMSLQKYLYRAVKTELEPWAPQAIEQLVNAYKEAWTFIERTTPAQTDDEMIAKREQKVARSEVVMLALEGLKNLKREVIPESQSSPKVKELLELLSKEEIRLKNYLATNSPGSELTTEAKKILSPKREGRVKSEETVLEQNAKRRMPPKK